MNECGLIILKTSLSLNSKSSVKMNCVFTMVRSIAKIEHQGSELQNWLKKITRTIKYTELGWRIKDMASVRNKIL